MGRHEDNQHRRQHEHVRGIPTSQGQRAELGPSAQHAGEEITRQRRAAGDIDRDGRRPVRLLIPGQKVTAQRESEDDQERDQPCQPRHLAWRLVAGEQEHSQEVHDRGDDQETGAPHVQPPHHPAHGQSAHHELHAVVGERRGRHVVHRQHDARDHLHAEEQGDDAAGRERPARAVRQTFVEKMRQAGAIASPRVEPVEQARPHGYTWTRTYAPSRRVGSSSSARGGGPAITCPCKS